MNFSHEHQVPRRRALYCLLAADWLALTSAVLFSTQASFVQAPWMTSVLLGVWVLLPVTFADFLRSRSWPRGDRKSFALAAIVTLVAICLGYTGYELMLDSAPADSPLFLGTALLALLTWCLAFLSFLPPIYRLLDFLSGGLVLMALLERRPDAMIFLPLWVLGMAVSAQTRHQLFDIHPRNKSPSLDLRRNGFAALTVAVSVAVMFIICFQFLYPRLDLPFLADRERILPSLWQGRPHNRELDTQNGPRETGTNGSRLIGFDDEMSLGAIASARGDQRLALRLARLDDKGKVIPGSKSDLPARGLLLRAQIFNKYLVHENKWEREGIRTKRQQWRANERIAVERRRLRLPQESWRITIVSPVVTKIFLPYRTRYFVTPSAAKAAAAYIRSEANEFAPDLPDIPTGSHYDLRMFHRPHRATMLYSNARHETRGDDRYRGYPSYRHLKVNLRLIADNIFGSTTSIAPRIKKLGAYFRDNFKYDTELDWLPDKVERRFEVFMNSAHRGDCMYFATAAILLLRAKGVQARIAGGYAGAEFDPARKDFKVINARAHAWVEILLDDGRWLPFDPTAHLRGGEEVLPAPLEVATSDSGTWGLRLFPDLALLFGVVFLLFLARRATERGTSLTDAQDSRVRQQFLERLSALEETDPRRIIAEEYQLLQGRLERRRRHRRLQQTPHEHRLRWASHDPQLDAPLLELETILDQVFYGNRDADAADLVRFRNACRRVRSLLG
ncbi:MAG: transglutaminase domain-containing protein [Planctomycetota bacterium]